MILKFAVKSGIIIGAVLYTRDIGAWGTPNDTEKIYNNVVDTIRPHVTNLKKQLPFEVPQLPNKGEVRYLAKHYYNQGVKSTINFIHMSPCYAGQLLKSSKDYINNALDAPAAK